MRIRLARSRSLELGLAMVVSFSLGAVLIEAQRPEIHGIETTTQQRIAGEHWWPTMSTAPLRAFAGAESCRACHVGESASWPLSSMARAASRASDATSLPDVLSFSFSSPPATYTLSRSEQGLVYSVAAGGERLSQKLAWVMGAGNLGQTFVFQKEDRWYQSRVSVYAQSSNLDLTTGLQAVPSADLTEALGKVLSPEEVRHCFSCHTVHSTTSRGFDPLHAEAGLGCEACHGPGSAHIERMNVARVEKSNDPGIFNPAELSPPDSIDFCGACHRTSADVTLSSNKANDTSVVRFQPYRLEKSRCWRETEDARLTCVACHDPHEPLNRTAAAYDSRCIACHSTLAIMKHRAKVCPKAADNCVGCHMPKVAVASMHGEFTDHFIRVVKTGADFAP